jgi:hypothetical protein
MQTCRREPTKASAISNQMFGFVSDAEGFIFLAASMVGQIEQQTRQKCRESGVLRDILGPSLIDILPMYIVFILLTPVARKVARSLGWETVLFVSFMVWAGAQFGLRDWVYRHTDLFGLQVPESSTGAFDLYGWQLLWMIWPRHRQHIR